MGVGVVTRAKKRRLEEEAERHADRISNLPDGVLGDIVSFLPTRDGGRTQILSTRWLHVWRSAPLNLDLHTEPEGTASARDISRILSVHQGPCRRFVMPRHYSYKEYHTEAAEDRWLVSPALDNLQELELRYVRVPRRAAWLHRFSSTLRVASFDFSGGSFVPEDKNNAAGSALRFPVLQQMTLLNVSIEESSLRALLAGCPVLESLLIHELIHPQPALLHIASPSLRSIGFRYGRGHYDMLAIVIEDAPCLERLLYFDGMMVDISVISAPRLVLIGDLIQNNYPAYGADATFFQGSTVASMTAVLPSVKVLSLSNVKICLDAAINLVKCFPNLERLYIKAASVSFKDVSYLQCQKHIRTPDIRVRKIVLVNYIGSKSHINFVKLFVSNSRVLESVRLELEDKYVSEVWIARQHKWLHIEKRASRGAQITLVPCNMMIGPPNDLLVLGAEKVHDLSTDPFQWFH